jgi:asparagine synthase (glutamine-hydrolysing)
MAMANSVELRFPFLDIDLVRFATTIPHRLKIKNGVEKHLIRNVARQRLPNAIVTREKFGFHSPGTPSLLSKNIEWINDLLSYERIKRQGYFNPDSIENLKRMYGDPNFSLRLPYEDDVLMIVLSFGIFLDVFAMPDC